MYTRRNSVHQKKVPFQYSLLPQSYQRRQSVPSKNILVQDPFILK
ncbi:hypothetical protein pb186bvf_016552 [Paramecium bursaria]